MSHKTKVPSNSSNYNLAALIGWWAKSPSLIPTIILVEIASFKNFQQKYIPSKFAIATRTSARCEQSSSKGSTTLQFHSVFKKILIEKHQ